MDSAKMNELLKNFAITEEIKALARNHSDDWISFGKMNSAVYRNILTKLMNEAAVTAEDKAMSHSHSSYTWRRTSAALVNSPKVTLHDQAILMGHGESQ